MKQPARYYMIGGFLGAGKTTAVASLARHLSKSGNRVGLITNDQGSELVDTAMLRSQGFATEEIPGGCFCCRFSSLVDAAKKLTDATKPDVFVAEPVGSCTDLIATVAYPLRRIYGSDFVLAPLSVLVDVVRAEQVFGMIAGRKFSEKVLYIWRKQVEEADLIVISKADLFDKSRVEQLRNKIASEFPGKPILTISARTGDGTAEWFHYLENAEPGWGKSMSIDYDTYAEGEALLGWLNATVQIEATTEFDAADLLKQMVEQIKSCLGDCEVAHLKMTFSPTESLAGEIAAISLVRSDVVPELTLKLDAPVKSGELIVNCRAEAPPERLRQALEHAVNVMSKQMVLRATIDHVEQFRPGRPVPTHRFESPEPTLA